MRYGIVVGLIIIGLVCLGTFFFASYYANNPVATESVTGITVLHNGTPLVNLSVEAYRTFYGQPKDAPYFVGPTDMSGTMSFRPGYAAFSIYGLQYRFLYGAETHAVTGIPGQVMVVSI